MEKGSESERQLGLGDKIAFSLNLGFCGKKSHLETSSILEEFFFKWEPSTILRSRSRKLQN